MLEQGEYPYIEGSRGINFKGVRTTDVQRLTTGSGRPVIGRFTPTSIQITDVEDPIWVMNAYLVDARGLVFDIRTHDFKGELAQPDFFAGRFVTFALHNLQASAGNIDFIRGVWCRQSKNFQMFTDALDKTGDLVEAARSTWTGRTVHANGFDVQSNDQVKVDERNEDTVIRVLFTRNGVNVSSSA